MIPQMFMPPWTVTHFVSLAFILSLSACYIYFIIKREHEKNIYVWRVAAILALGFAVHLTLFISNLRAETGFYDPVPFSLQNLFKSK